MAIGYLRVQARTAGEALPVGGAQVRILDAEGNTLYRLLTDESGETEAVPLETLNRDFSLDPDFSGKPYAQYGVTVEAEGFDPAFVWEIPIYDGETASLPVSLYPLEEGQSSRRWEGMTVKEPAVAFPCRRTQKGTLGKERVLRQVVIPDPITVHLGAPDMRR